MLNYLRFSFVSAFFLALMACSSAPDTALVENALSKRLAEAHLDTLFAVHDVTIRERSEEQGRQQLTVDYQLLAKMNLEAFVQTIREDDTLNGMDKFAMMMVAGAVRMEHGDVKEGDTFPVSQEMTFVESEEGEWFTEEIQ